MRFLAILVAVGVALYLGVTFAFPTYTHRYRLTIEIDTPEGVRSGSNVIEVVRKDVRWVLIAQGRYQFHVRGEAVFVDLGAKRNVIAILAHGERAENVDQMISLPIEAYGDYKWDEAAWAGEKKTLGPVELKPPLIPTLVTFDDLSNPKTAQIVYATDVRETRQSAGGSRPDGRVSVNRLDQTLGSGVQFKRAWIERTTDPIKTGIEDKMPDIIRQLREQAKVLQISKVGDPYRPRLGDFIRS